jgi:hypothetical protein
VKAQHGFPLGGEGGLVSCVTDLALWDRNFASGRVGGAALAAALTERAPFSNGALNSYARGLAVTEHRGIATASHGGLWPGYRTEFLRLPERGLTVICIANCSAIDPARLARQVADAALGLDEASTRPDAAAIEAMLGCWVEPDAPATVELSLDAEGRAVTTQNGVVFALLPLPDGGLRAASTSFPFTARIRDTALEVERDAGHIVRLHRPPANAVLPDGLAGAYECEELGTAWTIAPGRNGAMAAGVAGPLANAGPWEVSAIEGDLIRVATPSVLFRGWADARVLRQGDGGRVSGLLVNGGRARDLHFRRQG